MLSRCRPSRSPRACATVVALALGLLWAAPATAQIRVHPTGVNVNSQGATTVFLTFGGLNGYQSIEALWCSRLLPAAPDVGQRCDPSTILGSLPLRYDQSTLGTGSLTDIMSIPPSVVRRAYQAAEAGATRASSMSAGSRTPGAGRISTWRSRAAWRAAARACRSRCSTWRWASTSRHPSSTSGTGIGRRPCARASPTTARGACAAAGKW